jgi:deazaflavin-dependent oxidoreductase (nitroreductase family)
MTAGSGYTAPDLSLFGEEHIRRYLETGGLVGHEWNRVTTLILTTTGRKTGLHRQSARIYGRVQDDYVVIASQGGAPTHPSWYLNLCAEPRVEVHFGPDHFLANARTAEGEERTRLWAMMTDHWPNFDVYAARTQRQIPAVVLARTREKYGSEEATT